MGESVNTAGDARPLCVDLDGTLVRTDTLHESLCALLHREPLSALRLPLWLLRGRAYFKHKVAERAVPDPALLPYNRELLEFLKAERGKGRELVLITACNECCARPIAEHVGIFSRVIASDRGCNMRGEQKRLVLEREFGARGYDYVGNDWPDLPAWRGAEQAHLVDGGQRLEAAVRREARLGHVFRSQQLGLRGVIRMLRVHQWVKNLLIFVPILMAHEIDQLPRLFAALCAFATFCFCSSGVYIINDLLDLEADRRHPSKRRRPFAAGQAPLSNGIVLGPLLIALSCAAGFLLPARFLLALGLYLVTTFAYSCRLKQVMMIDIVVLAGLYSLRVFAGAAATEIPQSQWLLAFSMFMFFSLACAKRFSELYRLRGAGGHGGAAGRGYMPADIEPIAQFGSASGFISVLVLALYMNSGEIQHLYRHQTLIWLLCPALLYWVARVWLLAHRGELHEDPIVFALKDKVSYVVGAAAALILLAAKGLG